MKQRNEIESDRQSGAQAAHYPAGRSPTTPLQPATPAARPSGSPEAE